MILRALTITLQAPSLVEKAELFQVRFTPQLRADGVYKCKMDVKSTWY